MNSLSLVSIHLRVPDLARSVEFYSGQLGFAIAQRDATRAELAVAPDAPPILALIEDRAAPPAPRDAAGLFHAALLLPSRAALGVWLRFAGEREVGFDGFSDHGVSEAIYFSDPDGNGLEFYADRPRAAWPLTPSGELAMVTRPLALPSLLAEADSWGRGAPAASAANHGEVAASPLNGARWGHLHLRVTNLDRSEKFYRDTLGVALTQGTYPGARFLAADGYHHHLGLNVWGAPRRAQPPGALGLAAATFAHTGEAATRELRDPDGIALRVTAGS